MADQTLPYSLVDQIEQLAQGFGREAVPIVHRRSGSEHRLQPVATVAEIHVKHHDGA